MEPQCRMGDCPIIQNIGTAELRAGNMNLGQRNIYETFKYALLQIREQGACSGLKSYKESGVVECGNSNAEALANLAIGGVLQFRNEELRDIKRSPAIPPRY